MGYYVELIDFNAKLLEKDFDEAYRLMCDLNDDNSNKTGGRYPREDKDGPHNGIWFAWMDWNYPETCNNVKEILTALGFEYFEHEDGIIPCAYNDKTGAEELFLNSIAHLWVPYNSHDGFGNALDPFFAWRGEDGGMWRIRYADGNAIEESAVIVWE